MKRWLYNLDLYHKADGHTHRLYLCAGSRGYQSWGSDDPARVTWLPLVGQWASVSVQAAGAGGSRISRDDLRLINVRRPDGDSIPRYANVYDATADLWLRVEMGVRPLNILETDYIVRSVTELELDEAAPYSTAVVNWRAKAGRIRPDRTELRLPLWDRMTDFDAPVLDPEDCYAGTGGLEGPESLAGVTKERAFGWLPIMVPTYLGFFDGFHHYSANGGHPIEGVVRGWDRAAPFTMVTGDPDPDEFDVDTTTGIIRVAGDKPEDFRVELKGDKTGGVWRRHPGAIVAHLATTHGGIVAAADGSVLDTTPRTVGLHLPAGDTTTHRAAYDKLVGGLARGRWYVDLLDELVITRLPRAEDVTPTRVYRKAAGEAEGLRPSGGSDEVPAKQVIVRWGENPSTTTETAGAASADDVALWTKQWREAPSAVDAAVAAAWGASTKPAYVETAITVAADAADEAPLWLAEKADPPRSYELKVFDGAPGLWIGGGVSMTDDIAGFESGAALVVYGRTNRDRGGGATLFVER